MMGRDEGMMEVELCMQPWRKKELKQAKKIEAEGRDNDRDVQK